MDRTLWQQHLAKADRYVTEGQRHIARQRKIISELERDGHDAQSARDKHYTLLIEIASAESWGK